MWSKKGTWAWADVLYLFFFVVMGAIVTLLLVKIPLSIMDQSVQPFPLDAGINQERLFQKVAVHSPIFGVQTNTLTDEFDKAAAMRLSEKRYAYKISADKEEYFGNKEFYEDAVPLAPIRYNRFIGTKRFVSNGKRVTVTVDQVFPKRYEKRT